MTSAPSVHVGVHRIGHLSVPRDCALEDEEPLFAATKEFATEFGGPITGAFLEALPQDWRDIPLVIDTVLVWLPPGAWPGPRLFHREPYPESSDGAFGCANLDLTVEHIAVVLGPVGWEFVVGALSLSLMQSALPLIHSSETGEARARDAVLQTLIAQRQLDVDQVEPGELIQYPAYSFLRHKPTGSPGFHFSLRATRGSRQPLVNGFRTVV